MLHERICRNKFLKETCRTKERRDILETNTGVLKELATREAQLTSKVSSARDEAQKIVADAEAKAKDILAKAEGDARALEVEYKQKREAEEKAILDAGMATAKSAAEAVKTAASGKIAGAVKAIVAKVLP
jgi:vacuolar-type H+-ATPase subunit H